MASAVRKIRVEAGPVKVYGSLARAVEAFLGECSAAELRDPALRAVQLALERRPPVYPAGRLVRELRQRMQASGKSLTRFAKDDTPISVQLLSRILRGEEGPGDKVAAWLGYEKVLCYRRKKASA